ncbi:MAG: SDR family oxidoreductase [Candidatus Melainabacteria bacterium]
MDLGLTGKKALVCGASQGIGRAIALAFATEGAAVAITARSEEKLAGVLALMKQAAPDADTPMWAVPADLSVAADRGNLIKTLRETCGEPDILVHNGGGPPPTRIEETTPAQWETAFQTQFLTLMALNSAFLPGMKARGWGRILAVTSLSPQEPIQTLALSNGIRSAVTAALKTLATDVAAHGVTVNCIAPGVIHTGRIDALLAHQAEKTAVSEADARARMLGDIPAGRFGTPEEFADVAAFLCSERAAYITGSTVCVDGGRRRSVF